MYRKCSSIIVALSLLTLGSYAFGGGAWTYQDDWHNTSSTFCPPAVAAKFNSDWFDANNWGGQPMWACPSPCPPDWNTFAAIEAKNQEPCISTSSPYYNIRGPGGAKCSQVYIAPWSWTGSVPFRLTMASGEANCGRMIGLANEVGYPSPEWGYAILDVNGGTMTTPGFRNFDANFPEDPTKWDDPCYPWIMGEGLYVGGGNTGAAACYGNVSIRNDGKIIVPMVRIYYGDVNLLGGLLYMYEPNDLNLVISQSHPMNRINVAGGEFRFQGHREGRLNYYINKGRICPCNFHGTLVMGYNDTDDYTFLTAICTPDAAWDPKPIDGADRQLLDPTLTWKPGPWAQVDPCAGGTHGVYLDINEANVRDANEANQLGAFWGRQDPCSFKPSTVMALLADTFYYWRIDEYNNAAYDGNTMWKGNVWKFKTKGPVAGEPNPADETVGLNIPLQLSWGTGAFVGDVNGHAVFFGRNKTDVEDATVSPESVPAGVFYRRQSSTIFPLSALDFNLAADTNYYWRIDEINDSVNVPPDPTKVWPNPDVWMFRNTNYFIVDNFDTCPLTESFADMNNRWKTGYRNNFEKFPGKGSICSNSNFNPTQAGLGWDLILREGMTTGVMIFNYDSKTVVNVAYSEARLEVNSLPAGGKDWTGGGALPDDDKAKSIAVSYVGASGNAYNSIYDVMYMALEANDGNFGMVLNPADTEAQRITVWDQWEVNFAEVKCPNASDQTNIDYFYLGFGLRCNKGLQAKGGTGTVRFDDLRLYQKHCVPDYAEDMGLISDISDDCKVNLADIDVLATNWLAKQAVVPVTETEPPAAILWYKFDETTGLVVNDSSGNGYKGWVDSNRDTTVPDKNMTDAQSKQLWDTGGYNGGCFDMNYLVVTDFNVWIDANKAALQYIANRADNKNFSFSVWIHGDVYMPLTGWPRLISASQDFNTTPWIDDNEVIESWCPAPRTGDASIAYFRCGRGGSGVNDNNSVQTPGMPLSNFAGTWQHYAFVRDGDANRMRIYQNGEMIAEANKLSGPMLMPGVAIEHFRMGRMNQGSESYLGKIDDFKIYDYALSDAQAGYIGTGGTGYVPFVNVANIKTNPPLTQEFVNFGDFAIIGQQWMTGPILWP
ncbi:MAG: LamG domain-containing protein [Sedimentisphaerales bacterium]|nr:LamG domain-containing protein [Sedimentisphaerales bacterium]